MTLDEAIKECEEAAEDRAKMSKRYDDASGYSRSHNEAIRTSDAKEHEKCSQDFRQLAEWLQELKRLRAQHEKMANEEATQYIFDELLKHNLFRGVYDAKNGNKSYMHGVSAVMEYIAAMISEECLDRFNEEFTKNLIESEAKGNGRGKS